MAGGNGSPGRTRQQKVTLYVELPAELAYLVNLYRFSRRIPTQAEAYRRLLECHPVLTSLAESLYDDGNTSPQRPIEEKSDP